MNKRFSKVTWALILLFGLGYWGLKKYEAFRGPLKYQDLKTIDPYEATARETGGIVLKFDKDKMGPEQIQMQSNMLLQTIRERDFVLLWFAEGVPNRNVSEFKFFVDSSILELSVFVSAIEDLPQVKIFDSKKQEVAPQKILNSQTATSMNFVSPGAGVWTLRISAKSNLHIQLKAKSNLGLYSVQFVRLGGRPGHEGLFPYNGPLEGGRQEILSMNFSNVENLTAAHLQMISLSGRVLDEVDVDLTSTDMKAKVKIPMESFRILLTGENKKHEFFQRMSDKIFQLGRFELVEFKNRRDESKDSNNCKIISQSSHWTMEFHEGTGASSHLSCVEFSENTTSKFYSNLGFLVPVKPNGEPLKMQLISADYRKMTKSDCDTAKNIFALYPAVLKSLSEHQVLKWAFYCEGGPSEFRGVMEVTTSGISSP